MYLVKQQILGSMILCIILLSGMILVTHLSVAIPHTATLGLLKVSLQVSS